MVCGLCWQLQQRVRRTSDPLLSTETRSLPDLHQSRRLQRTNFDWSRSTLSQETSRISIQAHPVEPVPDIRIHESGAISDLGWQPIHAGVVFKNARYLTTQLWGNWIPILIWGNTDVLYHALNHYRYSTVKTLYYLYNMYIIILLSFIYNYFKNKSLLDAVKFNITVFKRQYNQSNEHRKLGWKDHRYRPRLYGHTQGDNTILCSYTYNKINCRRKTSYKDTRASYWYKQIDIVRIYEVSCWGNLSLIWDEEIG